MSLIFMDSFDHYVTADLLKKWNTAGNISVGAVGRRGSNGISGNSANPNLYKTLPVNSSWVMGTAFHVAAGFSGARTILSLLDAGIVQCELRVNPDLTLSVTRDAVTLTSGTSVFALTAGVFSYIEWKVTVANSISAGSCKVRVNGVDWITVATGQDLQNTANATANQVRLGADNLTGPVTFTFDDFYVCDQSGSTNNDFLGDVRIDTLYPTGAGNYTQFTPSAGANWTTVDEATPNTTDYNDGTTVGHRDSYGMGNLPALASQTVYGVQVNAAVMKDDAGAKSVATMVRSSTTDGDGVSVGLSTSQTYVSQVYATNPDGAVAWTEATVNAMEAGVRVTA